VSEKREPRFDHRVALVLRFGAFAAFFVMLTGVAARVLFDGALPPRIELVGVLIMLITPVVRVFVVMTLFFRGKDWRYGWISTGVLLILLLGSIYGIGEH